MNNDVNKKIKLFCIILFFIAGILLPSFISIKKVMQKTVSSKMYDLDVVEELVAGSKLEEDIFIPKNIKRYGLMFATYERKNKGKIKIEIIQKGKIYTEILDVSKIENNKYYYLKLNLKNLKSGEPARLRIEGIDGEKGTSVSMQRTSDIIYGELIQNGVPTGKSLTHNIVFYELNSTVKGQIVLLIFSIGLFFLALKLTNNEEKNNKKLYLITVLLVFCLVSIKAPVLTFKAEPYAEQIFNFLNNGRKFNFFQNLVIMDAGYLPLFQRLIALFIIKMGLNTGITSYIMSNASVIVVGMMVSVFTLSYYKKYGNRLYRFLISLIFGVFNILPYTETHTFIDFGYMCIILIFFIALLDFQKIEIKRYICLMILVFLLCLSKSHTIVLFPICILIQILLWKILSKREKIFLNIICITSLIQMIYILNHKNVWAQNDLESKVSFLDVINIGTHQIVQQFINLIYPGIAPNQEILNYNLFFLVVLIFLISVIIYLFFKIKNKESLLLVVLIGIIFGVSYLNVVTKMWKDNNGLWTNALGSINSRHAALIKISYILIFLFLPFCIKQLELKFKNEKKDSIEKKSEIFLAIIIIMLIFRYSSITNDDIYRYDNIFSDWKIYSKFYETGKYTIPIEPYIISEKMKLNYISQKTRTPSVMVLNGEKFYPKEIENLEKINELVLPKPLNIEFLYVKRVRDYNFDKVKLVGFDKDNNIIMEVLQLNKNSKGSIGFKIDSPKEIYKISFITESNRTAYVYPEVIIGEPLN